MTDLKRGREAKGVRRESSLADDDRTVVAPRFDEYEAATARPVVPLERPHDTAARVATIGATGATGGFSLRAIFRYLVLAWAVVATLVAGVIMLYRNTHTATPQIVPQSALESAASEAAKSAPQPARREVTVAPSRAPKMTKTRDSLPTWEVPDSSDKRDVQRDEPDEEMLDKRARKEEKRRRKEEKKRREEAEDDVERALKEARKQAERLRERMKDEGGRSRLIEVITKRPGL